MPGTLSAWLRDGERGTGSRLTPHATLTCGRYRPRVPPAFPLTVHAPRLRAGNCPLPGSYKTSIRDPQDRSVSWLRTQILNLSAQLAIEHHGADAGQYADGMMKRFAAEDDRPGTPFWLDVGSAIDASNNAVPGSAAGAHASLHSRVFHTTPGWRLGYQLETTNNQVPLLPVVRDRPYHADARGLTTTR
jgi:hypothetical protein